ncbi:hypothetical protein HMPREF2736_00995 [Corynebacterium sp. HMSC036E10]|uniref:6PGD fold domain-containing protein n=1 Tax=Corynebacterium TaxID=1716 RepID=UPI0008A42F1E|nr:MULTISPECIES: hypothetical protein [Corynebacterium]OFL91244.1 hypothetical protein HMPREF2734_01765 [Corynebacterium sp. HMSC055D05]OHO81306.1 hypothetical protein HMPREF2736_00995 [Corynebacterium sp. HMSC036E10]OHQ51576.1 hypothetical protein HMPREF2617_03095 [Corynebacterium sp. HMSC070H05]PLA27495.1 hypothetical protein CYJ45_08555 [Corynebacterium coyleae]
MAPRLLVGAIPGHSQLALDMERAGHTVRPIDINTDPGAIAHVDLVLIDGSANDIRAAAEILADYARPQQMFLHTALEEGPQLLDDVETSQAITMCAHNLFDNIWVTSAADELGETVVGLLIAEIGGTSMRIDDTVRPTIAAAQELRALEATVRDDALELLIDTVPAFEAVAEKFIEAASGRRYAKSVNDLDRMLDALPEPGVRRLFVDLQRRRGEMEQDTDTELWVIQKYEGR